MDTSTSLTQEKRIKIASMLAAEYKKMKGKAPDKILIFWLSEGPLPESLEDAINDEQLSDLQKQMLEAAWGLIMKKEATEGDRLAGISAAFFSGPAEIHVANISKDIVSQL